MSTRLEQLMAERAALDAEIEKLQNCGKRWKAKTGGVYWAIDSCGDQFYTEEFAADSDIYLYGIGNYHKTEAEALVWRERQIATQQIKDRIAELNAQQGWVADFSDDGLAKHTFYYASDAREIRETHCYVSMYTQKELHGSKETIKTIIKELEPQIKLLFGV